MKHELSDLVSSIEIAEFTHSSPQAVSMWKIRYDDFPLPVTHTLYSKREILVWLRSNKKGWIEPK